MSGDVGRWMGGGVGEQCFGSLRGGFFKGGLVWVFGSRLECGGRGGRA